MAKQHAVGAPTMAAAATVITKRDLMSWAKTAAIIGPILLAVIVGWAKVSVQAADVQDDLTALKKTVGEQQTFIAANGGIAGTLSDMNDTLKALRTSSDEAKVWRAAVDEKFKAQEVRTSQFWSVTWPSMEARLGRIETKLDQMPVIRRE